MKVLTKKRGSQTRAKVLRKIAREIDLLSKLQECCNVIQLLTVYEDDDHAYLVCELCRGGDLEKLLLVNILNQRICNLVYNTSQRVVLDTLLSDTAVPSLRLQSSLCGQKYCRQCLAGVEIDMGMLPRRRARSRSVQLPEYCMRLLKWWQHAMPITSFMGM